MGKKKGSSWLTAVKRAFRSPTKKEQNNPHGNEIEEDEEKVCYSRSCYSVLERKRESFLLLMFCFALFLLQKREKRRWLFRKPATQESPVKPSGVFPPESDNANSKTLSETAAASNAGKYPSAVVSVDTSATPAVVPKLTKRTYYARENYAAVVIQTSFRGYLVSN